MRKYKYIIYDLDGTLIDTRLGVKEAVKKTIADLDLFISDEKVLEQFVGPPMQDSFQKYFGFKRSSALYAANLFRDNYKKYSLFKGELYPGILNMLSDQIKYGLKLAVATNKSHENAIAILTHFGVSQYCEYMRGADLEGKLSKSDIIQICMHELRAVKRETLYIGDSVYDAEGANNVGIDFLGVTYGFGFSDANDLSRMKCVKICSEVKEINTFLKSI